MNFPEVEDLLAAVGRGEVSGDAILAPSKCIRIIATDRVRVRPAQSQQEKGWPWRRSGRKL